ncbi:MAG TPA: elongation factor EF-2 [Candidatus Thermoplasmatota archaeon]|nr:elongation factor EF-2 [Candidatus Thermoplasmatota archaeon]
MGRKEDNIAKARDLMHKPEFIRNIDIAAHIDHGKTTLSDNLVAGAGMMSEDLAGKQLVMDFDEQEAARGITINAASASMVHEIDGKAYLINLIDTPGHVDFGGDVTRAMRAVDGCVIVCCAVEGPMPQTETVVRQALREKVKPILFINKTDRLINELKLGPEELQKRFAKIITEINTLIMKMVPPEFKDKWRVDPANGSVIFGSAYNNWAINVPYMKKTNIGFKDIINLCNEGKQKELAKKAPLHKVLLEASIMHHPPPHVAQKYRIPHIWKGDLESEVGKAMINCDENGPLTLMVTKIIIDPHAGEIAFGRLFSGSVSKGMDVHVLGMPGKNRTQQVAVMVGADRIPVDQVTAGNIAAVQGIRDAIAGSTVATDPNMEPFERIVHVSEPVVTVAVEAKNMKDLPKLVDVLRTVAKADPSIQVQINQETGENLMSGMGELHLEITEYRIRNDYGVDIKVSPPIVVYRESVSGKNAEPFEGKSPNKHNKFYITVEPLEPAVVQAIKDGKIPDSQGKIKDPKALTPTLVELGWDRDFCKGFFGLVGTNVFVDVTKGIQGLHETKELILDAFKEAMQKGPRSGEPVQACKFILHDAKLHEDAVHRGPGQVIPAVRNGIYGAMTVAGTTLQEPMQKVYVSVPQDVMGNVTREFQQRRGVIEDMQSEGDMAIIHTKAPVSEMFGFAGAIRGAAQGRVLWSSEHAGFEPVPRELLEKITAQIRQRKGLKPEPYPAEYYAG